jgi:DNA-binding response OmpR family regulator
MASDILLIEDELLAGMILKESLTFRGFNVDLARDQRTCLQYADRPYALVLLSASIPGLDPARVLSEIRSFNPEVPVILMTTEIHAAELVRSFEAGYSDFIRKPFLFDKLLSKIKIFAGEITPDDAGTMPLIFHIGSFLFHVTEKQLTGPSGRWHLSSKEAELLFQLCRQRNKVVGRPALLKQIWGSQDRVANGALTVYITRLRSYLQSDFTVSIVNIRGVGYRLVVQE